MDLPKPADLLRVTRSTFTEVTGWKKLLMRLGLLSLVTGFVLWGIGASTGKGEGGIDWSALCLRSGAGYLGGFLVGALARLYLKLALLAGTALAALGFGLSKLGLVDLPWDSLGDITAAFADAAQRQASALQEFLSGYLPAGATSSVGVLSGVTQRVRLEDEDDED
jgi:uncharacterized membrane protein (Fun14 family)